MIRIEIIRNSSGSYRSFTCSGHAEYAEAGSDIICAGVSALVINTINCLQDLVHEKMEISMDEKNGGYIAVHFPDRPSDQSTFLLDCMVHGFDWIISQYGRTYLEYEIKEAEKC